MSSHKNTSGTKKQNQRPGVFPNLTPLRVSRKFSAGPRSYVGLLLGPTKITQDEAWWSALFFGMHKLNPQNKKTLDENSWRKKNLYSSIICFIIEDILLESRSSSDVTASGGRLTMEEWSLWLLILYDTHGIQSWMAIGLFLVGGPRCVRKNIWKKGLWQTHKDSPKHELLRFACPMNWITRIGFSHMSAHHTDRPHTSWAMFKTLVALDMKKWTPTSWPCTLRQTNIEMEFNRKYHSWKDPKNHPNKTNPKLLSFYQNFGDCAQSPANQLLLSSSFSMENDHSFLVFLSADPPAHVPQRVALFLHQAP